MIYRLKKRTEEEVERSIRQFYTDRTRWEDENEEEWRALEQRRLLADAVEIVDMAKRSEIHRHRVIRAAELHISCFRMSAAGMAAKHIGRSMGLTESRVRWHIEKGWKLVLKTFDTLEFSS